MELKSSSKTTYLNIHNSGTTKELNLVSYRTNTEQANVYTGNYNVTPKILAQSLNTANKLLQKNVKIEKIPYYEVSNKLGNTIIIGG